MLWLSCSWFPSTENCFKFRKYFRRRKIKISQILSNNKIMKLYFLYIKLTVIIGKVKFINRYILELHNLNGLISFSLNISNIFVLGCSWVEVKCSKWWQTPYFGLYLFIVYLSCWYDKLALNDFVTDNFFKKLPRSYI